MSAFLFIFGLLGPAACSFIFFVSIFPKSEKISGRVAITLNMIINLIGIASMFTTHHLMAQIERQRELPPMENSHPFKILLVFSVLFSLASWYITKAAIEYKKMAFGLMGKIIVPITTILYIATISLWW